VLDCGGQVNVTLDPNTDSRIREQAASTTTNLANYAVTYSGYDLNLPLGGTATCTITNTRITPRSKPLSASYWKNHSADLTALLPAYLGSFLAPDVQSAAAVFDAITPLNTATHLGRKHARTDVPRTDPIGVSPGTRPSAKCGAPRVGPSAFARAGS
jgi:hypothetical protein